MTTIATDGKTIAWDQQITFGLARRLLNEPKVEMIDGTIFGASGAMVPLKALADWYFAGAKPEDEPSDNFQLLVISTEGVMQYENGGEKYRPKLPAAIGSGEPYALTTMRLGYSPEHAIKMAAECDAHTGGEVSVMEITDLHPPTDKRSPWEKIKGWFRGAQD